MQSVPLWIYPLAFLLVLGPLVTLHELGHYLVGRFFGVGAEAFSVGFGKELAGFTDKRGTRWKLSAIPIGGYVQFKGDMNPASVPDPEHPPQPDDFHSKPLWQKALIVAAGPFANILIAVSIFAAFFMVLGEPVPSDASQENVIAGFSEESPAQAAGLREGDRVVAVEGETVRSVRELIMEIAPYPNTELDITVDRDGEEVTVAIITQADERTDDFGNKAVYGVIGIYPGRSEEEYREVGPVESLNLAVDASVGTVDIIVTGIGQILSGKRSVQELGGPITIAKVSGEQLSLGWLPFVTFAALISLNLAFINLLPIPALDGGHLAFYAVEAIRRKPASARSMEWAYRVGIATVLALMLFVTVIDIAKLPFFGS
ncbi:RIP metalloprotease RseP [Erythrobacter sp. EC-HK427]|uniref:RIP metalloprotease RseP n=1 Tax=Erythrobacter sp. EC-HK427 TaxID=2038396 RepID=UPI0018FEA7BC|nr:RIP metalloprotease RseP [Erythrobacter sp. EC-HK427]